MTNPQDNARDLQQHLRGLGFNVNVEGTTLDDGRQHLHVSLAGPAWKFVIRWLAHLPRRAWRHIRGGAA